MDMSLPEFIPDLILRPAVACVCGGLLGWNREAQGRPAGLRTQILVCLGACIFSMVTLELHRVMRQEFPETNSDPIRVIAGIVGGIGFLGAGSIIRSEGRVKGVTTAATVWVVGAIGIACGAGQFRLAWVTVGFTAITLIGLGWLEARMMNEE